jgi:hypothetical protein
LKKKKKPKSNQANIRNPWLGSWDRPPHRRQTWKKLWSKILIHLKLKKTHNNKNMMTKPNTKIKWNKIMRDKIKKKFKKIENQIYYMKKLKEDEFEK